MEYPTQPGYGNNRGPKSGFISRTQEGKFVIDPEEEPFNQQQQRTRATDEGGDEGGEVSGARGGERVPWP